MGRPAPHESILEVGGLQSHTRLFQLRVYPLATVQRCTQNQGGSTKQWPRHSVHHFAWRKSQCAGHVCFCTQTNIHWNFLQEFLLKYHYRDQLLISDPPGSAPGAWLCPPVVSTPSVSAVFKSGRIQWERYALCWWRFCCALCISETFVNYVDVFNGVCLLVIVFQFDFVMNFCFLYISSFGLLC